MPGAAAAQGSDEVTQMHHCVGAIRGHATENANRRPARMNARKLAEEPGTAYQRSDDVQQAHTDA